ncbi:BbrUII/HgiDII family restriction enzyme [Halalkalicoccus salilacus]|uniref:BbrUII/HgiDII family restriction enzyme n=1 Tax=Halalkalicoccus TaxID=332246 RepID=UPI002F961D48
MSLSLNVLNHLGLNLYSNVPAVLSEAVANAWDADAEQVDVDILPDEGRIEIVDDGHGMDEHDVNNRYLRVGYRRRQDEDRRNRTPKHDRPVMGRKGIGKLSLFSIARTVEVYTTKNGEWHAFRMNVDEIKEAIGKEEAGNGSMQPQSYVPTTIDGFPEDVNQGTKIVLKDLKKRVHTAESALRKRLARRFSILGSEFNFTIRVNGEEINITDRDYFHKVQFLWTFGNDEYVEYCRDQKLKEHEHRSATTENGYEVKGWIGTVEKPRDLVEDYPGEETEVDDLNKVSLMVRGKMAKPDLLEDFNDGRMYTKYLVGEIHADFLDYDDEEDIATSNREDVVKDDERYQELLDFLRDELNHIANRWGYLRNEQGSEEARKSDVIDMWYESLSPDNREQAQKLFGKINQMAVNDEDDRKELFKYGVLAFEDLKYKQNLEQLEATSAEDVGEVSRILGDLEDLDATRFHQIVTQRLQVIKKLQQQLEEDALETILQEHLGEHPWLLDPSWERAAGTDRMEKWMRVDYLEEHDEAAGRINLKCVRAAGKHILIDLKRPDYEPTLSELQSQAADYRESLETMLRKQGRAGGATEVVIIVGHLPDPKDNDRSRRSRRSLDLDDARVLQYDNMLTETRELYESYIDNRTGAGRVSRLIDEIEGGNLFE